MNDMTLVGSMLAVVCVFIVSWAECGFTYSLKCGTERVEQDDSGINIGINMGVCRYGHYGDLCSRNRGQLF